MSNSRLRPVLGLVALVCALMQGCESLERLPPIPLPEGNWELVTATFAETGRVPGARRATLAFSNGQLSAFSGCNTASGAMQGGDGRLEVPKLTATRQDCPEPLAWFESRFFKLLRSSPNYHLDGNSLALFTGSDTARFRRLPGAGGQPGKP